MRFFNSVYFKILCGLAIGFVLYAELFVNPNKDLDIFIGASKLLFEGQSCYDVWIETGQSSLKYFYSPLFAILMYPLKELPQLGYVFVWFCLNIFLTARILKLLPTFIPIETLNATQKAWFWFLLFLTTVRSFYDTLGLGQMTIILVWGSLASVHLLRSGRVMVAAALLALIINVKLIPLALLGYLVYKGEWKMTFYTIVFSVIYLLLPILVIGYDFNAQLLSQWLGSLTDTGSNSLNDDYGRQSLSAYIPALLMDTPLQFNSKRNIASLTAHHVDLILNISRLVLMALLAYLFGKPFQKAGSQSKLFYDMALVCLVTPLFFPHQGKYSFFYLLPAQAFCMHYLVLFYKHRKQHKIYAPALVLALLSFALLTLTTDGIIGRRASDWCEYYNFITYGTLLLMVLMVLLNPCNAEKQNGTQVSETRSF